MSEKNTQADLAVQRLLRSYPVAHRHGKRGVLAMQRAGVGWPRVANA